MVTTRGWAYFVSISCCFSFVQDFFLQICKENPLLTQRDDGEVPSRFELENKGFADLRLTAWLWHRIKMER